MTKKFLFLAVSSFIFMLASCGAGGKTETKDETKAIDDDAFYATQPVHSGLYNADYYDITGTSERKGKFDGRIYFSLSPETSAFYVFENGNRTKIDYQVNLQKPFEKNDSGVYVSIDAKNQPVCINTDSTTYFLDFQRGQENIKIGFDPKPRHEGTALEILEKMAAQKKK
ncbi:MAG: hypothetical protein J1F12_05290 [Muribaculaceae bacterium]|nr:hypothetical protein [Muribaculaceae bacterium]